MVSFLIVATVSAAGAKEVVVRLPPESLANWYKPQNERQVWLHTMFGLREAMQAVEYYTDTGNRDRAIHWSERLHDLYTEIPRMVPEWQIEVEPETMERLVTAVRSADKTETEAALRRLDTTCDGCHSDFQATAAALYRSPDYGNVSVADGHGGETTYPEAMRQISRSLNDVKIALKDGFPRRAQAAVATLRSELDRLSGSCASCHRDSAPRERIFAHTPDLLDNLHTVLEGTDRSAQGRLLGELGVTVCARCHSVHRTLGDLRDEIER
ncbi:hypothetical protein SAMN03097708_01626 [Thiohalomonas denitrificans]|uniref:Uncharacterized protein n=1 Tax=Thiohalomonas denitrificans TaxID=415747 RepID=A0A1G5Q8J2_9GAMM|nr:hypothetical protein SAMN03097708_01626 [Thiohalomonas denitrificans]